MGRRDAPNVNALFFRLDGSLREYNFQFDLINMVPKTYLSKKFLPDNFQTASVKGPGSHEKDPIGPRIKWSVRTSTFQVHDFIWLFINCR